MVPVANLSPALGADKTRGGIFVAAGGARVLVHFRRLVPDHSRKFADPWLGFRQRRGSLERIAVLSAKRFVGRDDEIERSK